MTELVAAYAAEVESRLMPDNVEATLSDCIDVIRLGNEGFRKIYDSVWEMVDKSESDGVASYVNARCELEMLVMAVSEQHHRLDGKIAQRLEAASVVVLVADCNAAKPGFDAALQELGARCKAAGVEMAPVQIPPLSKDVARVVEKIILVPILALPSQRKTPAPAAMTARKVTDMVRGMLSANSMHDVAAVLRQLAQMVRDNLIVVVRIKCRFVTKPSDGGWRDVLVNFYVASDPLKHIGELQVSHSQMANARKGLPGHVIYARVRNSIELVLMVFGKHVGQWRLFIFFYHQKKIEIEIEPS